MNSKIYLLFFLFYLTTEKNYAQITFQRNVVIDQSYGIKSPNKTVLQDVDNDGLKDLYTTASSSIAYVKNLGNGQYSKPIELLYSQSTSISQSELIDIDHDGIMDLVYSLGNYGSNLFWKKGLSSTSLTFADPIALDDHVH